MTDSSPSFENASVAALLAQRSREDRGALLNELVSVLTGVIPGVQVERSLLRRNVKAVRLPVGEFVYVLRRSAADAVDASRHHIVRGVAIKTVPLELDVFLEELGLALDAELRRTDRGRDALQSWLNGTPR